jgi:hypothetical protein
MRTSDAGSAGELVKSQPGCGLEYGYCTRSKLLLVRVFAN